MAGTDFSHLTSEELIKGIQALKIPDYIRSKAYGVDVRETLAQMTEMTIQLGVNMGLSPDDALKWARKLQETVSQSEFDSWVATLLDGGPSIFMNTLSELQTAYPNGASGVALVRETDPAKIYVWTGSAWEDFGDYQGIEVKDSAITTNKIADGAVTTEKTDFIMVGKNLFDGTFRYGYLNPSGKYEEGVSLENDRSGLIRVEPNTTYTISKPLSSAFRVGVSENVILHSTNTKIIFDDKTKTSFTYTTTNDEHYLAVYLGNVTLPEGVSDFLQVELGSQATEWEPYKKILKDISVDKADFIIPSKNIFDGSYRQGYLQPDGRYGESEDTKNDRTGFVTLEPNTTYTISKTTSSAFRVGVSSNRITSSPITTVIFDDKSATEFTFTTDATQRYLVVYVGNITFPEGISEFMQVEEGSQRTEWVTKGNTLKNQSFPYFITNANTPEYFGIKGDGVTDDSDGLNNYANHLKEQGGGRLELPRKKLLIKKTITIPSNTIVDLSNSVVRLGNDYNLSERVWRGGSQMKPYFVTEEGSENILFKNFSIVGNKQDIRSERHIGLGVFDSKNVDVQNVNVYSINYNPLADPGFGNMVPGIGLFIIRSEDVTVMGGAFDEGGYENIGTEHSKDIIIDGVHSGKAWRTSIQPHRATENLKILNSTIYQETATSDSAAMTLHGQDDIDEGLKNILISGNTIHGEFSTEPTHDYNALIQIMDGGTAENITVLNNTLKGNRTGIYGAKTDGFSVVGNNISLDKGDGIDVRPGSTKVLLDQNIVSTLDGSPLVDTESIATLGTNIGV